MTNAVRSSIFCSLMLGYLLAGTSSVAAQRPRLGEYEPPQTIMSQTQAVQYPHQSHTSQFGVPVPQHSHVAYSAPSHQGQAMPMYSTAAYHNQGPMGHHSATAPIVPKAGSPGFMGQHEQYPYAIQPVQYVTPPPATMPGQVFDPYAVGGQMAPPGVVYQQPYYQPPTMMPGVPAYGAVPGTTWSSSRGPRVFGGIDALYIRPYWNGGNPAYVQQNITGPAINQQINQTVNFFDYGYSLTPRIYAGVVSENGLGLRASWWRYSDNDTIFLNNPATAPGAAPQTFTFNTGPYTTISNSAAIFGVGGARDAIELDNRMTLNVLDVDIAQAFVDNCNWQLVGGAGARYAYLNQEQHLSVVTQGLPAGVTRVETARATRSFNGAGPTISVEGRRRIGETRLNLYGAGRSGVLFGRGRTEADRFRNLGGVIIRDTQRAEFSDMLPFIEGEAGVEWYASGDYALKPFLRAGVIGQSWFGAGTANTTVFDTPRNLGFFGFLVGGGLSF